MRWLSRLRDEVSPGKEKEVVSKVFCRYLSVCVCWYLLGFIGIWSDRGGNACAQSPPPSAPGFIDYRGGRPFSTGVRGQNPYRQYEVADANTLWNMAAGASGRGVAGGLDADTYDWRDLIGGASGGFRGGWFSTLEFLRYARNYRSSPLLTVNFFGGGYHDPAEGFVCQFDNPEGLAADWVRYANFILQQYRTGQEASLSGEDLRVYESITGWHGKPRLLPPGEEAVPRVTYWEIGNEPEWKGGTGWMANHRTEPAEYVPRYKSITSAMLAVDPSIQVGPCLTDPANPGSGGKWLTALAADPAARIDFVSYHPYYKAIRDSWGNVPAMTSALRGIKTYLAGKTAGIRSVLAEYGRTNCKLMATEWNPVNWDAADPLQASVANGLGVVESVFSFAEDDVFAAHFWTHPESKWAIRDMFNALRDDMGDVLLFTTQDTGQSPSALHWRVYVTRDTGKPGQMMIWGLNFAEDKPVEVPLPLVPLRVESATLRQYGMPDGNTSLTSNSGMTWRHQDVSADFDFRSYRLPIQGAGISLLILRYSPLARADFDGDGDVDQADFGIFQTCLSGDGRLQLDAACAPMRLDGDLDVDGDDLITFRKCMSGAGAIADAECGS